MAKNVKGIAEAPDSITWSYREGENSQTVPWGPHKLPVSLNLHGVSAAVERIGQGFIYRRDCAGDVVEKTVLTDKGKLLINPIEPLHRPVNISNHLLVEFERPVAIEPRSRKELIVTFPLELAVMIERRGYDGYLLDVVSLAPQKFTLYGRVDSGLICRYWKSGVYSDMPEVNPLETGIMKIDLQNSTGQWAEVHRGVFSAQGMKIYYGPMLVSLIATMRITGELTAETGFYDQPLQQGMKKAAETFSARLLSQQGRTVMEEGY